jgi:3-hydroxy-9,10-secoandrosta-1,3,5(10)-triene-9,17-dione monooxygenase
MLPTVKKRATETEALRRIPDETVRELRDSELLRIGVPKMFGGLDAEYRLMFEIGSLLGSACAATSWCFCIWAAHSWLVGHWPYKAQQEVFGSSPDVLSSSSLNPGKSTLEETSGGFKLSGHWEFSSGSDSAEWVIVGANRSDRLVWILVPHLDYEIADTWFPVSKVLEAKTS